jgi:ketosteroid isomerase-like protein
MKSQSRDLKQQFVGLVLACCVAGLSVATEPTSSQTAPPTDARQQLLELEKEWAAAEDKHDAAVLRRILDDRFVATFGAAKTYDKEAFIKLFAGDVDPTVSQTLSYEAVIIDGDTAVLVGTDTARGTKDGTAYTAVYRYTVTYIRRHGQWLALAEHIVKVPPAK